MEGSENRIAEVRDRKGLKQNELAGRIGVSRSQLANIEAGTRKVDLPELRLIARMLNCTVVDLLLPSDAPGQPDSAEAELLTDLRAMPNYDPRAVLIATRGVITAANAVVSLQTVPKMLPGDPSLANALVARWADMDDPSRRKALGLLDAAREFNR